MCSQGRAAILGQVYGFATSESMGFFVVVAEMKLEESPRPAKTVNLQ